MLQNTLRGLLAEGSRKDGTPVRGRIAQKATKRRDACSAEGSRKVLFVPPSGMTLRKDFPAPMNFGDEGLRKVPQRVQGTPGIIYIWDDKGHKIW